MRTWVVAALMAALAGCASTAPSGVEVVRVAPPQTSEQERIAAYWKERENAPSLIPESGFAPRETSGFPSTRESDDQAWQDTMRLEREAAERRKAMRDAIQR